MKLDKKRGSAEIPTASMADIAFLLIIFFMLTTTFSINKGFDYGLPPIDETETETESRPDLTVIVDTLNDVGNNYQVMALDESGNKKIFTESNITKLYDHMLNVFKDVQEQQPDKWHKLPVYILVRRNAPFDGWVDTWEEVKRLEAKLKPQIKAMESDPEKQKLATHVPHVNQVEEIIAQYKAQGKLD